MTVNSVIAALSTWHTLKLTWQQRISDHHAPIRFFASHALKDNLTQLGKNSSHFTLQMKYLVSLLWKLLHRFKLFKLKLSLDDETKDYIDRNTGGQVNSLHEVTELG